MIRTALKMVAIAGTTALLSAGSAAAQGLDFLHEQRAEGGRWCMIDHVHQGTSNGQSSRAAAERAAIASYTSFTAWEYGNNWGSWRIAASRKVSCSQSGGGWGCSI